MDARLVWDTWRRILTDDQLVEWVLDKEVSAAGEPASLTAEERAIVADYASTPAATDTNIGMFRRGLVRNALAALSLAPLSRHLFYMSELDVDEVAADFAQSTGYVDYGPNFWRTAADFIEYLATLPEFVAPVYKDVLALDAAKVGLARRLGESAPVVWPDSVAVAAGSRVADASSRFVASRAAVVASSSYDLTSWIEDPDGFDPDEKLELSTAYWLIYFPDVESEHAYAQLSERSARVFNLLSAPLTATEVSIAFSDLPPGEALEALDSLVQLGMVVCDGDS
jgi:hypothetical protein